MSEAPSLRPDEGGFDEWIGRVVDERYRVQELIGEGGMGAVFRVEHIKLGKSFAMKVILPEIAGNGELARRFAGEAAAAGRLDHPHVAHITDYGVLLEGGAYLVMKLVRGPTLSSIVDERGHYAWPQVCEIGAQVADALVAAHDQGVVHRDLKPDNVMLEPQRDGGLHAMVLDFGVARLMDGSNRAGITPFRGGGAVVGTPGYMAPEQALGESVDHRADLYSLGALLWELLTGSPLFEGLGASSILTRQLTEAPPRVDVHVPEAPLELGYLIRLLLAKDPERRPSARETRDTLSRLLLGAAIEAVHGGDARVPHLSPSALVRAASEARSVPVRSDVRRRAAVTPTPAPRRPAPVLALGGAAALLVGVAAGLALVLGLGSAWTPSEPPRAPTPAAVVPVPAAATPAAPAPSGPLPLPAGLDEAAERLLSATSSVQRRRAARPILAYRPPSSVPPAFRALARLVTSRNCPNMRSYLLELEELGDRRVLPALDLLAETPRDACQRRSGSSSRPTTFDCLGCLRADLGRVRTVLAEGGSR